MDFFFWAFCFAGTCWVQFAFGSWAQDSILLMGSICSTFFFFLFPLFALSAASFLFGIFYCLVCFFVVCCTAYEPYYMQWFYCLECVDHYECDDLLGFHP